MKQVETGSELICEYTTWYHLLGVLAYLHSLPERPAHVIFVRGGSFFGNTVAFPQAVAETLAERVSFCSDSAGLAEYLPGVRARGRPVVLVTPQQYPLRPALELHRHGIRHRVIVTEEGIGSYGGEWQVLSALWREWRAQGTLTLQRAAAALFTRLAKMVYFLPRKREYWQLFDRRSWLPRPEVVAAYKAVLPALAGARRTEPPLPLPCTLFMSTPLYELGKMDADRFRQLLLAVADNAGGREQLVIKPHPIEGLEKYAGYRVIAPGTPLELLLLETNPEQVRLVGFSSTTLYTSWLFFNIRPLRVAAGDWLYDGLSRRQKGIINACTQPLA
ncbi:MAG TPA: hypothetical protein VF050_10910 [Moraxellaceae bacterium]